MVEQNPPSLKQGGTFLIIPSLPKTQSFRGCTSVAHTHLPEFYYSTYCLFYSCWLSHLLKLFHNFLWILFLFRPQNVTGPEDVVCFPKILWKYKAGSGHLFSTWQERNDWSSSWLNDETRLVGGHVQRDFIIFLFKSSTSEGKTDQSCFLLIFPPV